LLFEAEKQWLNSLVFVSFQVPFFFAIPDTGICTARRASIGAVKKGSGGSGLLE
jgi:hypothetical protein